MNGGIYEIEGMINLIKNIVSLFIIVLMSQVLIIQAGWMDGSIKVRRQYPRFISE
jgi:hypothetical protein